MGLTLSEAMKRAWRRYYGLVKCTILHTTDKTATLAMRLHDGIRWRLKEFTVSITEIYGNMVYDNFAEIAGTKRYVIL